MQTISEKFITIHEQLKSLCCRGLNEVNLGDILNEDQTIKEIVHQYFIELGMGRVASYSLNKWSLEGTITLNFDWGITRPERTYKIKN